MANELSKKYNTIKVFNVSNDTDEEALKHKIKEILNFQYLTDILNCQHGG